MKSILIIVILSLLTGCTTYKENFSHISVRELSYIKNVPIKDEQDDTAIEESQTPKRDDDNMNQSNSKNDNPKKDSQTENSSSQSPSRKEESSIAEDDSTKIIMTREEIVRYNETIMAKTSSMYDIQNTDIYSKNQILEYVNSYRLPVGIKYDGPNTISEETIQRILENRNLDMIADKPTAQRGIIVRRSNLKSFPTAVHFYNYPNASNFDQIQETELTINTPVRILHTSKDNDWYFIISPIYYGWVQRDDVALARESDWKYFIDNQSFVTITVPSVRLEGQLLDMGTTLPLIKSMGDNLQIALPTKDETGYIVKKNTTIASDEASIGFLPYTKANVIAQAQKYRGIKYSWGGMNSGVDCSSFIMDVFKTFGFRFPRNTSNQKDSIGTVIILTGKTNQQKLNAMSNTAPSILYQPGHTMIYLGRIGGRHSIIHASGSDLQVVITTLENSSYLPKIDRIVTIP